jgi:hypothetical protein
MPSGKKTKFTEQGRTENDHTEVSVKNSKDRREMDAWEM